MPDCLGHKLLEAPSLLDFGGLLPECMFGWEQTRSRNLLTCKILKDSISLQRNNTIRYSNVSIISARFKPLKTKQIFKILLERSVRFCWRDVLIRSLFSILTGWKKACGYLAQDHGSNPSGYEDTSPTPSLPPTRAACTSGGFQFRLSSVVQRSDERWAQWCHI